MPVISKKPWKLTDPIAESRNWHWSRGGFVLTTTYSSKDDFFKAKIPDYMAEVLGMDFIKADTRKEIEPLFKATVREYNFRDKEKHRVIMYVLLVRADHEVDGKHFEMDTLRGYDKLQSGLSLWYKVCWETTNENGYDKKYLNDSYSRVKRPSNWNFRNVMMWTPEREQFFEELSQKITELAYRANAYINDNKDLGAIIDAGGLLPFYEEEKP